MVWFYLNATKNSDVQNCKMQNWYYVDHFQMKFSITLDTK